MTEPLPTFRYHPDPVGTGSVVRSDVRCVVCDDARGWIYTGPVFALGEHHDQICPWCIADGRAAEQLGARFTDADTHVPADVPAEVLREIEERTVGFVGWQQERWLFHCADAAAFLGLAGHAELAAHPGALQAIRDENAGFGWSEADLEEYLLSLAIDGEPTAYLFRCRHCGQHLAYSDFG